VSDAGGSHQDRLQVSCDTSEARSSSVGAPAVAIESFYMQTVRQRERERDDDISVVAACDCHFKTSRPMTGRWYRDTTGITKERKKGWNIKINKTLHTMRGRSMLVEGLGDFGGFSFCLNAVCACVCALCVCICRVFSQGGSWQLPAPRKAAHCTGHSRGLTAPPPSPGADIWRSSA